jgi:hypothetical protein
MPSVSGFTIFVCLGIVQFGNGYLYWFKADEYFDRLSKGIGEYYKSPPFIWIMRLGITVFIFVYIYVLVKALIIKQP